MKKENNYKKYLFQFILIFIGFMVGYDLYISYYFFVVNPQYTDVGYLDYIGFFSPFLASIYLIPTFIILTLFTKIKYFLKLKFNYWYVIVSSILFGFLFPATESLNYSFVATIYETNEIFGVVLLGLISIIEYILVLFVIGLVFNQIKRQRGENNHNATI